MNKIFVSTAAFNETDLINTIESCMSKAAHPENITFGVAAQYPDTEFPNLTKYKNVRYVRIDDPMPWGTSPSRALASLLRKNEDYFLSIDAHSIFKPNWDLTLIECLTELKKITSKPVITTYTPFWNRNFSEEIVNQLGTFDLDTDMPVYSLKIKNNDERHPGNYVIPSPTWDTIVIEPYKEHYLASAHLLFSEITFLDEVPFDPNIVYYEENTTAMRAWTRGYRLFAINKDVLWTREMFKGKDVDSSWRQNSGRRDSTQTTYIDRIVQGSLRCKNILLGNILGIFGAPNKDLLVEYEKASGINHQLIYANIDKFVRNNSNTPSLAKAMHDLENLINEK
jgi:hypothetical protein